MRLKTPRAAFIGSCSASVIAPKKYVLSGLAGKVVMSREGE